MIEPAPNCFSIERIAASTALDRSPPAPLRSSVREPVNAMSSLPSLSVLSDGASLCSAPRESAFVRFFDHRLRLPRLADHLDLLRWLGEWLELWVARRPGLSPFFCFPGWGV